MEDTSNNKLYIGNLDYGVIEADLTAYFSNMGTVKEVLVIKDRETGNSKGFGFVTMGTSEEAEKIMEEFDGTEFKGRKLIIRKARPRQNSAQTAQG